MNNFQLKNYKLSQFYLSELYLNLKFELLKTGNYKSKVNLKPLKGLFQTAELTTEKAYIRIEIVMDYFEAIRNTYLFFQIEENHKSNLVDMLDDVTQKAVLIKDNAGANYSERIFSDDKMVEIGKELMKLENEVNNINDEINNAQKRA